MKKKKFSIIGLFLVLSMAATSLFVQNVSVANAKMKEVIPCSIADDVSCTWTDSTGREHTASNMRKDI